jgi:hypothetical protein
MKKLLLALAFVGSAAQAGVYETGNTLLRDLENSEFGKMYVLGYVVGAADAYGGQSLCIPATVTKGQLLDVVHQFLRAKPQHRDLPADVLVLLSLAEHWACPKNNKRKS